ncbi:MAG: hypothetical protein ACKVP7_26440 [Hyphomicrobiaceae bacterium]
MLAPVPQSRRQRLGRLAGALAWLLTGLGLTVAFPVPPHLDDASVSDWNAVLHVSMPSVQLVQPDVHAAPGEAQSLQPQTHSESPPPWGLLALGTDKDEPVIYVGEPVPVPSTETSPAEAPPVTVATSDAADMARFLDRLMLAESGGRDTAKNPRSSALGPFQFIDSTFLEVTRRHFAAEIAGLTPPQVLALRTDRPFARRAAEAFTRDNADVLAAQGLPTSFANLRLAFLLGPGGAVRVLKAETTAPVISIVGVAVVQANPFMAGMTVRDLAAWSERNLAANANARLVTKDAGPPIPGSVAPGAPGSAPPAPPKPVVTAKCNLALASCRRWLAIATKQVETGRTPRQATTRLGAKRQTTATR